MSILDAPLARAATRQILAALDQGPRMLNELPHRWPVTRALVRGCVAELAAQGVVQVEGRGARRRIVAPSARLPRRSAA